MTETRRITHCEARISLRRLVRQAFWNDFHATPIGGQRRAGPEPIVQPEDEDLVGRYIQQQEEKEALGRYIAFAFDYCYPDGGIDDMVGWFDSLDEAVEGVKSGHPYKAWDYVHVIDVWTGEVTVYKGRGRYGESPFYEIDESWKPGVPRGAAA